MEEHIRYCHLDPASAAADVYELLLALRPSLHPDQFRAFAARAVREGYNMTVAYDEDGRCVGVAGYRILATTRGRILFIDDLVTRPEARSLGIGGQLFGELERRARRAQCDRIELDSATENVRAHAFYASHGMSVGALHFNKEIVQDGV